MCAFSLALYRECMSSVTNMKSTWNMRNYKLRQAWSGWNILTTLADANRTRMTNTYCVYTVLRYSWWWTVDLSETCRVLYQINLRNSASRWLLLQEYITIHGPLNVKYILSTVRKIGQRPFGDYRHRLATVIFWAHNIRCKWKFLDCATVALLSVMAHD